LARKNVFGGRILARVISSRGTGIGISVGSSVVVRPEATYHDLGGLSVEEDREMAKKSSLKSLMTHLPPSLKNFLEGLHPDLLHPREDLLQDTITRRSESFSMIQG
jgi:hypothetical protein